jgi:hypothetical protein
MPLRFRCCICKESMPAAGDADRCFDPCAITLSTNADREWGQQRQQVFPCHFECFRALIGDDTFLYIMDPAFPTLGEAEAERDEASLRDYVDRARSGDADAAFHGLRELDRSTIPTLEAIYRAEADPAVRALIVRVIWEHRDPSAVGFLADALKDPEPEVWKAALDGLVTLGTSDSAAALASAREIVDAERRAWIEEAIGQIGRHTAG